MFIVYTQYKNSVLATMVSYFGSAMIAGGVLIPVLAISEGEEILPMILTGVVFVGLGLLTRKGAEKIAVRKEQKRLIKEVEQNPVNEAIPSYGKSPREAAVRVCKNCGTRLEADDMFCYQCGNKL